MVNEHKSMYETPMTEIFDLVIEGVICYSQQQTAGNPESRQSAGDWGDF